MAQWYWVREKSGFELGSVVKLPTEYAKSGRGAQGEECEGEGRGKEASFFCLLSIFIIILHCEIQNETRL